MVLASWQIYVLALATIMATIAKITIALVLYTQIPRFAHLMVNAQFLTLATAKLDGLVQLAIFQFATVFWQIRQQFVTILTVLASHQIFASVTLIISVTSVKFQFAIALQLILQLYVQATVHALKTIHVYVTQTGKETNAQSLYALVLLVITLLKLAVEEVLVHNPTHVFANRATLAPFAKHQLVMRYWVILAQSVTVSVLAHNWIPVFALMVGLDLLVQLLVVLVI